MIEIGDCDEMADRIGGGVLRPGDYVLMISDGQIIGGERITDSTPLEMLSADRLASAEMLADARATTTV